MKTACSKWIKLEHPHKNLPYNTPVLVYPSEEAERYFTGDFDVTIAQLLKIDGVETWADNCGLLHPLSWVKYWAKINLSFEEEDHENN